MSVRKKIERTGDHVRRPEHGDVVKISTASWLYDKSSISSDFKGKSIGALVRSAVLKIGDGVLFSACEKEIMKMYVGERALLTVSSALAYGKEGIPNMVPPNADLIMSVKYDRTG